MRPAKNSMMLAAALFATVLLGAGPVMAGEPALPSVDQVTKHLNDLYRSKSSHGTMRMEVKTKRFERSYEMEAWSVGEDKSLVVVRSPAKAAGMATLKTKDGLWSYAPRADRLIRIPTGLLGDSWLGSHFTNDDLMRESSFVDDYKTALSWTDENGKRELKAVMTAKKGAPVVYPKIIQFMTPDTWLPTRADYYDAKGRIARSMHSSRVKKIGGKLLPTRLEVKPADKPTEHTIVTYVKMRFDLSVKSSIFTPRGLRKAAQQR